MFFVYLLNRCVFTEDFNEEIYGMPNSLREISSHSSCLTWKRSLSACLCVKGRISKQSSIWSRMKLLRRGADGQQFRQVFWACAINDRDTHGGKLKICSLVDRKPVQWARKRGNMVMLWKFEDNKCSIILKFFESVQQILWVSSKKRVSMINYWEKNAQSRVLVASTEIEWRIVLILLKSRYGMLWHDLSLRHDTPLQSEKSCSEVNMVRRTIWHPIARTTVGSFSLTPLIPFSSSSSPPSLL